MDENKKIKQSSTDSVTPTKFWGTLAAAGILLLICVYFFAVVVQLPITPIISIGKAVFLFTMAVSVISIVLVLRHRQELGLKLAFYAMNCFVPLIVLLFQGRTFPASLSALVISAIIIGWLFPTQARRWYSVIAVAGTILSWIIEWINPPWRIQLEAAKIGPAAAIIFGIVLAIIVVRQTWGRSMRNKLLVALLGVTMVAVGILAVSTYTSTSNILRQGLERELTQHVAGVSNRIGDLLVEQVTVLTAISLNEVLQQTVDETNQSYQGDANAIQATLQARDAEWKAADAADNNSDPLVQKYLSNQAALDLKEFQHTFPNHVEVFITDVYGGQAGTTNRTSDYLQSDEGWWQAAYNKGQGAVYISEPEFDESSGALTVLIAMPIRNRGTGEIVGILRSTYLASALNPVLGELLGKTGETDLFIPGEVASHFHAGGYTPVASEEYAALQAVASQGMAQMEYEGKSSVVLQAPVKTTAGNLVVDNLGWTVVFHQDQVEAFAPLNAQIQSSLVVMAIILILALAAAIGLAVVLVRPITRLTQTAEEIAAGNLSSRATVTSSDEIGILASTFNTMTSQLQETLENLEQRVADRTKALATSTEVSRRLSTILDQKELVSEVVNQVKNAFGYYHAQIYFYDEARENLIMAGGTGEAGALMLAQFHKIAKGRGLVGRAAEGNQPVLVADTSQNPEWLPNKLLPETESEVAIPITLGDQVLGVLDVQHNVRNGLQQEDVNTLQSIANQVAIALQNIRQFQASQKVASDLGVVADVGIATATITDVQSLLQEVVDLSKKSFKLYHAHIYLLDKDGDNLVLAAGAGEVGRQMVAEGRSIPLERESLVARAARTQVGVVINDVTLAPDFLPNPLLPETRSEMAVPMLVAGKVIGVLDVQSEQASRFTEVDVNVQTTLASQVAVAVQNARTFAQSQEQAAQETVLNQIVQKIQSTTTMDEALKIAARELGHALGRLPTLVELDLAAQYEEHKGTS